MAKGLSQNWEKSSHSNGNGGNNCVEGRLVDSIIEIRDTKDKSGPSLKFTKDEWRAFVAGVRDGEFDVKENVKE